MINQKMYINSYVESVSDKYGMCKGHAFEIVALAILLNKGFDEIISDISTLFLSGSTYKGTKDFGLDGVWFEDSGSTITLHVYQMKYSEKELVTLSENELDKFISDVNNLFCEGNPAKKELNSKIKKYYEEYVDLTKSGRIIDLKLHFVFFGDKNLDKNPKSNSKILNKDISKRYENDIDFDIIDLNDLGRIIRNYNASNITRKDVDYSFSALKSNISTRNDPQAILSFTVQNVKAVNFRLSAYDLCEFLTNEKNINGTIDTAFSANIRGYLQYQKSVANVKIKETLISDDAEYFSFLNNGITVIAEKVRLPSQPQVGIYPINVKNPSIVNGLQTTNVIYDVYNESPESLEGVDVMIRLYEADDAQLIDKITDATNTQTPIDTRDKLSNKKFNSLTRDFFKNKGIGYIHKRGESFLNRELRDLEYTVSNAIAIKFWYSTYYERPEVAKQNPGDIFERVLKSTMDDSTEFGKLFVGDLESPIYNQLYIATLIHKKVVEKRTLLEEQYKSEKNFHIFSADELVCYIVYQLLKKDNLLEDLSSKFDEVYDKAIFCLNEVVSQERQVKRNSGSRFNINSLFRSSRSRYLIDTKLSIAESDVFELREQLSLELS